MSEEYTKAAEPVGDEVPFDNTPRRNYPKIEKEDIYGLTIHSINLVDGRFGKQRVYGMAVDGFDPEKDGVLDFYAAATGGGDKNTELANAVGVKIDGPTTVKKSDLLGKKCRGIVVFKVSERTGKKYAKIEKVLAA